MNTEVISNGDKEELYRDIKTEWPTFKQAVLSVMNDRPNQHSMIISIVDYHIEI